ncbi:TIM barrel protein [Sphingobacterium sp. lm-10]|uniref:TIM barrel protein n=1 Tax=Sphingobacterium sp. lm-10 TaxID=2944904 RepID=UPI0020214B5B|nr:TIM barrel protein [Sphingobacterium sp. lm-10]MCL7986370.1 TIM barrel protein [Sphingobacterium sp. lm-10]
MEKIRIANAPCSWGVLEFDFEAKEPEYEQVLREIQETGYIGTELGDWGFMPTDPNALRAAINAHELELVGAFVPVALAVADAHEPGKNAALRVAKLLKEAGYDDAFIVLADDNGSVTERTQHAGRIVEAQGLTDEQWQVFAQGAEAIANAVRESYGLRTVFHHHGAGYVETVNEVETFLKLTDPSSIGLCFDTGHYALGGGNPIKGLQKYIDRIWHVHFKDFDPSVAARLKDHRWDYFDAVRHGIFCELGKGNVDFHAAFEILEQSGYEGWIVVEQDVLPGMGRPKVYAAKNRAYLQRLGI